MPRTPRAKSESGIYHVMLRRVGRQYLFEDDGDRSALLTTITRVFSEEEIDLLAWCFMDNHVHLVIFDHDDALSRAMHRVNVSYALRLNRKCGHVGHVFQDRFLSKPVDDDNYLLEVIRYVHNNPVEAGVGTARDYSWSSYAEYAHGREGPAKTDLVLDMLGGPTGFEEFVAAQTPDSPHDILGMSPSADSVLRLATEVLGVPPDTIGGLPKERRDEKIRLLGGAGLSVRQIERVTGIGRNTVSRALRGE